MLFAVQTHVRQKNHVLVVGAHWRFLTNTAEPSVLPGVGWLKQLNRPIMPFRGLTYVGSRNNVLLGLGEHIGVAIYQHYLTSTRIR